MYTYKMNCPCPGLTFVIVKKKRLVRMIETLFCFHFKKYLSVENFKDKNFDEKCAIAKLYSRVL